MNIYHYTTFDNFVKIWLSEELLLCEYKNMNDIYEKQKFCGIEIRPGKGISKETINQIGDPMEFIFRQISKFRQISFCKDYDDGTKGCTSSMMWGQYAKNEKGVCIEFDKEKLLLREKEYFSDIVQYNNRIPYINIESSEFTGEICEIEKNIKKVIIDNKDAVFFSKHTHWEHENEFRIVSDTKKSISIQNAITCIYVQKPDSTETRILKKLISEQIPIKYLSLVSDGEFVDMEIEDLDDFKTN